jgi:cyclohexa-1,5-dienecarbonyl-CoA hydratase
MPGTKAVEKACAERRGATTRLTINRPPLNILDLATLRELNGRMGAATEDPSVKLIEIRGSGERAFSSGTEIRDHFPERAPEMLAEFHALVRAFLYAPRPTLAVVRGQCLGGGMELAMASDFILASEDARFGLPEIKLGAFPPVAAALLPCRIPEKIALEMILTGEIFSAEDACRWGLVNRVERAETLDAAVEKFSNTLLSRSPHVLALARKATRLASRESFESALREAERIYMEELLPCGDAVEGLRAYLEKRPPVWKDE